MLVVERLYTELPGLDVELVDFFYRRIWCHHDVERLGLVDVLLAIGGLLNDLHLVDFGEGTEDGFLFISENIEMLD